MLTGDSDTTLTNEYLTLRIEPRHGGRIVSLTTIAGELTVEADRDKLNRSRVPDRFGLLSLQLWQDSYWHNDLCHVEWPITNSEVLPDRKEITLIGRSLLWWGLEASRRVVITEDDPWIDVEHRLDPGSTTGPYLAPAFWFSNVMHGRGHTFIPVARECSITRGGPRTSRGAMNQRRAGLPGSARRVGWPSSRIWHTFATSDFATRRHASGPRIPGGRCNGL